MSRPPRTNRTAALLLTASLLLSVGACSSDDDGSPAPTSGRPSAATGPAVRQPALEGTLTVFAADSMADALPVVVERFNVVNPGVEVTVRYDSTPVLAMELLDGAPADVYISADEANMQALVDGGRTDGVSYDLVRNRLVIVTAPDNPEGIASPQDLEGVGATALCESGTPCGVLADDVLESTDAEPDVQRHPSGAEAIAAVIDGSAVAALVFDATARAAGTDVEVVGLPPEVSATSTYTVATLAPAVNALAARAFVEFIRSSEGIDILVDHDFLPTG